MLMHWQSNPLASNDPLSHSTCVVSDDHMPSFSNRGWTVMPGDFMGTQIMVLFACGPPASAAVLVLASKQIQSACGAQAKGCEQ